MERNEHGVAVAVQAIVGTTDDRFVVCGGDQGNVCVLAIGEEQEQSKK